VPPGTRTSSRSSPSQITTSTKIRSDGAQDRSIQPGLICPR
jgi:hypothetical protein